MNRVFNIGRLIQVENTTFALWDGWEQNELKMEFKNLRNLWICKFFDIFCALRIKEKLGCINQKTQLRFRLGLKKNTKTKTQLNQLNWASWKKFFLSLQNWRIVWSRVLLKNYSSHCCCCGKKVLLMWWVYLSAGCKWIDLRAESHCWWSVPRTRSVCLSNVVSLVWFVLL